MIIPHLSNPLKCLALKRYIQPIFTSATTWKNKPSFPMSIKLLDMDKSTNETSELDSYSWQRNS